MKNQIIKISFLVALITVFSIVNANSNKLKTTNNTSRSTSDTHENIFETDSSSKKNSNIGKDIVIDENSNDNLNEIMSTMGGCNASCCTNNSPLNKKGKTNINKKSSKKDRKFRWFPRNK